MATTRIAPGSSSVNNVLSENKTSYPSWASYIHGSIQSSYNGSSTDMSLHIDSNDTIYFCGGGESTGYFGKINKYGVLGEYRRSDLNGSVEGTFTDSSGNIYVLQNWNSNPNGTILTKFNINLVKLWSVHYVQGTSYFSAWDMQFDASNNPTIFFNSNSRFTYIKINPADGSILSQKRYDNGTAYLRFGHIDSAGNIYMGGQEQGQTSFYGSFFFKLNSSGVLQWARSLTTNTGYGYPSGYVWNVKTDSSNNVYAVGVADHSATLQKGFIIKYDSSGTLQWKRQFFQPSGTNRYMSTTYVEMDSSNNIYIAAGTSYTNVNDRVALMKWDSSGNLIWQRSLVNGAGVGVSSGIRGLRLDNTQTNLILNISSQIGSPTYSHILKLPTDGSKTGTLTVNGIPTFTYSAGNFSTDTATDLNSNSHTPAEDNGNVVTITTGYAINYLPFPSLILETSAI